MYMSVNSGRAMAMNVILALVARLRGYRVVMHHHTYFYIRKWNWRVRWLDRFAGRSGLHVVLCKHQMKELRDKYGLRAPMRVVPSTVMLAEQEDLTAGRLPVSGPRSLPTMLGHISNLSLEKGLEDVVATFEKLRSENHDVRLILAGKPNEPKAASLLDECLKKHGELVDYRGPVYGEDKHRFFGDIDVMVFPSRNEAQPVVISEAYQYGVPVIAIGLSCVPYLMEGQDDCIVPVGGDYVGLASALISKWRDEPRRYAEAVEAAKRRSAELCADAQASLDGLARWVHGGLER